METKLNKKGFAIGDLLPLGMTFVVLGIGLAIGAKVVSDTGDGFAAGTAAKNATTYSLESLQTLASWLPTIALVVVAAVIIGILVVYLMRRFT